MTRIRTVSTPSRTDQVRQRRSSRSQKRLERAVRHVTAPPVTVRGSSMGSPLLNRTATRPRRVFNIPMQGNRSTFSVAAPSIHLTMRSLSLVVVIAIVGLLIFLNTSPMFKVEKPRVVGTARLNANDLEVALKLTGQNIFALDPGSILNDLKKAFPEVTGASVSIDFPNVVAVKVQEAKPVLAWKQKDQVHWIDQSGAIFDSRGSASDSLLTVTSDEAPPPARVIPTPGPTPQPTSTPEGSYQVPSATPDLSTPHMDLSLLYTALELSRKMPEKANLVYASLEGLGWHDSRGWDVFFGIKLDDFEMKFSMYQAMVTQLTQKGIKPKYINLKDLNAPYYRLER